MMAKEEKRVTRSRTGCLPAAKRKKTDSLDDIVSTAEKTVENQLKENHAPDPMLSPPLPSRSARKAKQPKIKSSLRASKRKLSKLNSSSPGAIDSQLRQSRLGRARKIPTSQPHKNNLKGHMHRWL